MGFLTEWMKNFVFCMFHKREERDVEFVKQEYDAVAGNYTKEVHSDDPVWCYVNDMPVQITKEQAFARHYEEMAEILKKYDCKSILEVGAGELTALNAMAEQMPGKEYYAIELSQKMLDAGLKNSKVKLMAWNCCSAERIPYPDKFIDVVYTHHSIEQMPEIYKKVIDEMKRVAKVAVIMFEPCYELGDQGQRWRMAALDYVIGLEEYTKTKPVLMKNSLSLFNRTGVYIISGGLK